MQPIKRLADFAYNVFFCTLQKPQKNDICFSECEGWVLIRHFYHGPFRHLYEVELDRGEANKVQQSHVRRRRSFLFNDEFHVLKKKYICFSEGRVSSAYTTILKPKNP